MTPKRPNLVPALLATAVIALVCLLRWQKLDLFERLENMSFDMRARAALRYSPSVATNLGFVFIDEDSVKRVWDGSLGYRFGLYWPRQVYGRLVQELALQGARAVALDIIFGELRPDQPPVQMADGTLVESDEFFAQQMRSASNVILAATPEVTPPALFLTNALAIADISTEKDADGILRRVRAFRVYRRWHPVFRQMEADPTFAVDLRQARLEPHQLILPRHGLDDIQVPLDADGNFDLADFLGDKLPPGQAPKAKPFTEQLVWHMGVILAAQALNLDLARAELNLAQGRITLRGPGGLQRVIPVNAQGYFYIDWSLPENHPQLALESIQDLLAQNRLRGEKPTNQFPSPWRGKLAVVGSSAVLGNNLTDRGATPLRPDTLLVGKHWNVANSIITGRFVRHASLPAEFLLIALMGAFAALLTWRLRVLVASTLVALLAGAYLGTAILLYVRTRYCLPLVMPVGVALVLTHLMLVTWRVLFEQAERRRVRSIFATVVSPKIVQELLAAEHLSLGGARREVSILFADVRGFTELTDAGQESVAALARQKSLSAAEAQARYDEQARQALGTINLYLGRVADTVIEHDGTLDKFIGDCVMAFWGAPTPNSAHALICIRAAMEAQRAIYLLNRERAAENQRRQAENLHRQAAGKPPLPLLPILFMGTGINTGMALVGLMGSEAKTRNYTVFGREVNLASRLESLSGRGRILIGETTFRHLQRDDPALAAICVALPAQKLKGISAAVTVYEVPWRPPGSPSLEEEFAPAHASAPAALAQGG